MRLDSIDKKLLSLLQNDSKQTSKQLSLQLNLSVTAVYERIKKLENHVNRIMKIMLDSYKDVHSNVALQEYFKTHTEKLNF